MSVWLAIIVKRGIRITKEVLNQYLHAWWSSSIYFYCSLFKHWIWFTEINLYLFKGGNRKLHITLIFLIVSIMFIIFCYLLLLLNLWVFYTVSLLFCCHIAFYMWLYDFLVWICWCLSQCIAYCIKSWQLKWCD